MTEIDDLRASIARWKAEIVTHTREANRHAKIHARLTWENDYHPKGPTEQRDLDRMAAAIATIWSSVALMTDKLAADQAKLDKLTRPTLWQRIKQALT